MRVRERVGRHLVTVELAEDAPPGMARAGVDEHVAHQVDVDRVRREPAQHVQAVGEALHAAHPMRLTSRPACADRGRRRGASSAHAHARAWRTAARRRCGCTRLPAAARRARDRAARVEAGAALPGVPARQPLERARRRPAGRERLGGARAQHRPRPPGAPRLRRRACTRDARSASRTRPCRAASGGCACRFDYADESDRGRYPIPRARADRGRAQLGRRPPRDRRGPRPLPAVRAVRGLSAGRRAAAGAPARARSGACARTGCARAAGRRRTPPGCRSCPAWPATRRCAAARSTTRCASRPSARGARTSTRRATSPRAPTTPDLPPMGLRVRLRAGFDTSGFPRQARDRAARR